MATIGLLMTTNAARVLRALHQVRPRAVGIAWDRAATAEQKRVARDVATAYRLKIATRKASFPRAAIRLSRSGKSSALPGRPAKLATYRVFNLAKGTENLRRGRFGGVKRPTKAKHIIIPFRGKPGQRKLRGTYYFTDDGLVIRKSGQPIGVYRKQTKYGEWYELETLRKKAEIRFQKRLEIETRRELRSVLRRVRSKGAIQVRTMGEAHFAV